MLPHHYDEWFVNDNKSDVYHVTNNHYFLIYHCKDDLTTIDSAPDMVLR